MARGLWNGSISFGLLNIPISLMSSTEESRLSFRMLDKRDISPIGYKQINKSTGREVPRKNISKGYEYEKNKFILLDEKDFAHANPKATQTIDIEDFVDFDDLDFLLFSKPYYLVPAKHGEKGYVLLREVLKETNKVAIAKFVLRNRQHLVSIIPKEDYLILEILRFAHEIKEVHEVDFLEDTKVDKVKVSPREMKMAKELVKGMTSKWKPDKYKDTYQNDLMKMINTKIRTGKTKVSEYQEVPKETDTNVVDLMPLLQKSLKANLIHARKKKVSHRSRTHA